MGYGICTPAVSLWGSMAGSLTSLRLILVESGGAGAALGEWELILAALKLLCSITSLKPGTTALPSISSTAKWEF